ncbi:type II toxin-antitoxin system YafQ family toxin [Methylovulum miyakonense]|uniref:type II toxin-antitoxin system YafQ family toxin n=1 Tax=Methylovulum miyakonense TaxID=645578 RepID=UPI000378CBE5|nr:type II toxin-antitoxin system YafQ family toxin [Methylovulum miyakonense]
MREVVLTSAFKKDYKRLSRSGQHDIRQLQEVTAILANDDILEEKYRDHALIGNWQDCRECHIKPDWLLIYQLKDDELILIRTGSHSELF